MSRPRTPPPLLRATVSSAERSAIEQVLGSVPDESLLRAVRDGRGRTFQRLEYIGDSILDLVLAVHVLVEPSCPVCLAAGHPGDPTRLVTDRQLGTQARRHGIGRWLEWEPSDERLADLVETSVAVAWRSGGWGSAAALARAVVHPIGPGVTEVLRSGGWTAVIPTGAGRRVGAALLELAAAQAAYDRFPEASEGELSEYRARIHRADRIAAYVARSRLVDGTGDADAVSNRVERWLTGVLAGRGADVALAEARVVLR